MNENDTPGLYRPTEGEAWPSRLDYPYVVLAALNEVRGGWAPIMFGASGKVINDWLEYRKTHGGLLPSFTVLMRVTT